MAADGEPPLPSEMQAVPLRVLEVGSRPFSSHRRGEGGHNCCALPSCTWPYPEAAAAGAVCGPMGLQTHPTIRSSAWA